MRCDKFEIVRLPATGLGLLSKSSWPMIYAFVLLSRRTVTWDAYSAERRLRGSAA